MIEDDKAVLYHCLDKSRVYHVTLLRSIEFNSRIKPLSPLFNCEYREPGGGYRMADQSSAGPKWIPCYDKREFEFMGKEHTTKWNSKIFMDGTAVTKGEFMERVIGMGFAPPLGVQYMAAR